MIGHAILRNKHKHKVRAPCQITKGGHCMLLVCFRCLSATAQTQLVLLAYAHGLSGAPSSMLNHIHAHSKVCLLTQYAERRTKCLAAPTKPPRLTCLQASLHSMLSDAQSAGLNPVQSRKQLTERHLAGTCGHVSVYEDLQQHQATQ
jgi:hypothetical protein